MAKHPGALRQNTVQGPYWCVGVHHVAHRRKTLTAAGQKANRPARRTCLLVSLLAMIAVRSAFAEEAQLSANEQARLAQQFAPVLVFHGAEKFFPTSPLFPIDTKTKIPNKGTTLRRLGTT